MNAATPGPWMYDAMYGGVYRDDKSGYLICELPEGVNEADPDRPRDKTADANMTLIAAAPTLLAALEICISSPITAYELAIARAAIKKAQGAEA